MVTLICLIYMSFLNVQLPKQDTIDLLKSTTWSHIYKNKACNRYEKYENNNVISTIRRGPGELVVTSIPYYLSNEIEERFDSLKIGKNRNGKYIITEGQDFIVKDKEKFASGLREALSATLERKASHKVKERGDTLISQLQNDSGLEWRTVVIVTEIIKISENELILKYIPKEIRIGNNPTRYIPYNGDIK